MALWLTRLPTERLKRAGAAPSENRPLALYAKSGNAFALSAVDACAAKAGLRAGMALADARAMQPSLAAFEADEAADLALLKQIAIWCERFTPIVAVDAPDGLFLDISGCAHLFGGEAELMRDMAARLFRQGLSARLSAADTAGCAWAVARYGHPLLVPQGGAASALERLPLSALRIDDETVIALGQAGLKRICDVTGRPRAPLAARFGQHLLRRLDQALGREEESIVPRLPVASCTAERRF
ncbi:MAG: DNA polymerase Y family protein, partial [Pseudomonadota bacterium]